MTNLCQDVAQRVLQKYVLPLRSSGGRVPTNRALAAEMEVNVGTVAKALSYLGSKGYIRSVVGSGTYVNQAKVNKNQFGIYYGDNFFNSRPQDRIYSFLDREFHRQCGAENILVRQYLDTNTFKGEAPELSPVLTNDVLNDALNGLFIATAPPQNKASLLSLDIPTVGYGESYSLGGVFLDHREYAIRAVETLIQRNCRRLALMPGFHFSESHAERYFGSTGGFVETVTHSGLSTPPEWLVSGPQLGVDHIEYGRKVFRQIWHASRDSKPDGIVIGTDAMALGALQGAQELGVKVPGDILFVVAENHENIWLELGCCIRFQFCMLEVAKRVIHILSAGPDASPVTLLVRAKMVP